MKLKISINILLFTLVSTFTGFFGSCEVTDSLRRRLTLEVMKAKSNRTLVLSPLALRLPFCKLATVAKGEAKIELLSGLGITQDAMIISCYAELKEQLDCLKQVDLLLINKLYVNYTNDIDPKFSTNSTETFGVQVEKVGFDYPKSAISFINRWFDKVTLKRIPDILDYKDIDVNTTMVLVNGAHFKGTWEFPFDIKLTKPGLFRHLNNNISEVQMMTKNDELLFLDDEDNNYKVVSIRFGCMGVTMLLIVPNSRDGLPTLISQLYGDPNIIQMIKQKMKWTYVRVVLPRFKIKTQIDLTDTLKLIGLKTIFNNTSSDLNLILKSDKQSKNICLNKVKQKIFIDVDEMGSFRHKPPAPWEEAGIPINENLNTAEIIGDRPFYFSVNIDTFSNSYDLFNGVYYGPE